MKAPCLCKVYIWDGKGSNFKGYFFQNKWALSCLYVALNNDIIPTVLQLLGASLYLHQWFLRLHKCPSLPPSNTRTLETLKQSPFRFFIFFGQLSVLTESEHVFVDIGTSSEPANTIRFYWESVAATCLLRSNQLERRHPANMERVTLTHSDKLWVKCMSGLWGRPRKVLHESQMNKLGPCSELAHVECFLPTLRKTYGIHGYIFSWFMGWNCLS